MEQLLSTLHWLGLDPKTWIASLIVAFLAGWALPAAGDCLRALADHMSASRSGLERAAAPILERLAALLGSLDAQNPQLNTLAGLLAQAIVEGAPSKQHAAAAARKLARELASEVAKALKAKDSSANP